MIEDVDTSIECDEELVDELGLTSSAKIWKKSQKEKKRHCKK